MSNPPVNEMKPRRWLALAGIVLIGTTVATTASDQMVLARTLGLGLAASCVALPIGIAIWCVLRQRGWLGKLALATTVALAVLPLVIHVSSWDAAIGKLGWLAAARGNVLEPLVSGWLAAIWIHGIAAAPQVALLLLFASDQFGEHLEQQAVLDASRSQVFWQVTLPRISPILLASAIWVVINCAREITVTDLYQIGTLAEQIYLGYSLSNGGVLGNWTSEQLADASDTKLWLILFQVAIISLCGLAMLMFLTSKEETVNGQSRSQGLLKPRFAIVLGSILMLILVIVPLANVLIRASFFVQPVDGVPVQMYSVEQIGRAIRRALADYRDEFFWSSVIAASSASLCLAIGLALGWWARESGKIRIVVAVSMAAFVAIPGPVIGTSLASLLSVPGVGSPGWLTYLIDYTILGPVIASVAYLWPLAVMFSWYLLRKIPQPALENARLEGASGFRRAWTFGVIGNLIAHFGCWILLFSLAFGELSASQLVRPAGMDTVARKVLGDLHAGVNELTAGITIVIAVIVMTLTLSGFWLIRLNHRGSVRQ